MENSLVSAIRERHLRVLDRIAEAARRSGRVAGDVRLVIVTKSQPVEVVQAAIAVGACILGENYAEEAATKIASLPSTNVEWHMIGHVQSRKADLVAGNFSMIHSLDSVKLARKLNESCKEMNRKLRCLLEVNTSGEASKFGFAAWGEDHWLEMEPAIEEIAAMPNLHLQGLMTMPPFFEDSEQARPFFKRLRQLQQYLMKRYPQAVWTDLSMGTSADYEQAIEEGATFVRVGQAILGPRDK